MSDNAKPTNGGSKYKIVGGQLIVDEKNKEFRMPPEGSTKKGLPKDDPNLENPDNYVSIPLIPDRDKEGPDKD